MEPSTKKPAPLTRVIMGVGGLILAIIGIIQMTNGFKGLSETSDVKQEVQANVDKSMSSLVEFTDPNFTMKYPSNWQKDPAKPPTILKLKTFNGVAACIVNVDALEEGTTLDTYAAMNKDEINAMSTPKEGMPTMKLLSEENVTLNGMPGKKFVISMKMPGKPDMRNMPVMFVVGKSGYAVTLASAEEQFPQFETLFRAIYESIKPTHAAK